MIVGLYAWKIHKRIKKAEETIAKKHVLYVNGELSALHQFNTDSKSHAMNTIEEQLWRHATSASNLLDLNSERDLLKKKEPRLRNPFESRTVKKMEKSILADIPHTHVVRRKGLKWRKEAFTHDRRSSSSVDEGTMKRGLAIAHKKRKRRRRASLQNFSPAKLRVQVASKEFTDRKYLHLVMTTILTAFWAAACFWCLQM